MSYILFIIIPDIRTGDGRNGSNYFLLLGTYNIMKGTNQRMGNRENWKQKHVNPVWEFSQMYLCHRLT